MEVLDPTVSHDDAPLCVNDSIEKVTLRQIPSDTKRWIKARHTLGFMGFIGFALVYAMRVNLSVAIVSMVNQTATPDDNGNDTSDVCPMIPQVNGTFIPSPGEFNWSPRIQGLILGSFFIGYVITNVPGGRMAEKVGGKLVYGLGIFLTAVLTVISPFAAYWGLVPFFIVRIAEGFTEGVTFPAMHTMLAHWVPPLERSKFAALVYAGSNFGTVISLPLSGWLCSLTFWGGWPLAFYLFGGLGIIWSVFWLFFIYNTPAEHPTIDLQEKLYIEACVEPKFQGEDRGVPWMEIFKSAPMWAITITQCGQSWAFYTLLIELPTYMEKILHYDVESDAVLSTLPYLTAWIMGLVISSFADFLLERRVMSTLTSMKFWNSVASVGVSLSFVGAIWAGCDRVWLMIMLAGVGSLQGATYAGNQMNHISLAPRYAGTLYGISNATANICGFLAPSLIGYITDKHEILSRWHEVFWLAAAINIVCNFVYLIFASAKEQPWNRGS